MPRKSAALFAVLATIVAWIAPPAAAETILFEGARIIPGDGSPAIEDAAFLVEGGTITRIGRRGEVAAPAGATRIDLAGKTVMPAIVSTHVHPGFQKGLSYLAENFGRETIMDDLNRERYFGVSTAMSPLRPIREMMPPSTSSAAFSIGELPSPATTRAPSNRMACAAAPCVASRTAKTAATRIEIIP